jgi:hypothetical protein
VRLRGGKLVGFTGESDVLKEATARATEIIRRAGLAERVFVDWKH